MERIRVGVIGAGFGARVHVPAFRSSGRSDVAVICAGTEARAREAAASAGVDRWVVDWRRVIDDTSIDAVTVATPPALQGQIAAAALAAGKPVFCEKPLAASLADAQVAAAVARQSGLANVVDFEFPEIDAWQAARAALDEGVVGTLRHVSVDWKVYSYATRHNTRSWKTSEAHGGGALNNFGAHVMHYIEWFCGPMARCFAAVPRVGAGEPNTCVELTLELESGAIAAISIATDACAGPVHRLEFFGTAGTLTLENRSRDYGRGFHVHVAPADGSATRTLLDAPVPAGTDGRIDAVGRLAERFLHWIDGGPAARPDFTCGARVQALLAAAAMAVERGCCVDAASAGSLT